jgi:hypothetical protein
MNTNTASAIDNPDLVSSSDETLLAAIIADMGTDPKKAYAIKSMQTKLNEKLAAIVDKVAAMLGMEDVTNPPQKSRSQPGSVATMVAEARHRDQLIKQRRELAEGLVIGSLLNADNSTWDPMDEETHRPNTKSVLVQILVTVPR